MSGKSSKTEKQRVVLEIGCKKEKNDRKTQRGSEELC